MTATFYKGDPIAEPQSTLTWRFMGSYKWGYKSRNMGYNYSYPTYNPTCN